MKNFREYRERIISMAEDVIEEVKDGTDLDEALDGWADSCVTYTSECLEILQHTNNDDALFDVGMDLSGIDSASEIYQKLAYCAVREDIREKYEELKPNEEEEEEEEESE